MRILLVRHGQSEGNLDTRAYVEKGDRRVELSELGWKQALGAGAFLANFYKDQQTWPVMYNSSFMRTRQTLAGIMHHLRNAIADDPILREDPRLIEKHYGATNILTHTDLSGVDPHFAEQFLAASNATHERDPFNTPNPMGESDKENLIAVRNFIDGSLARAIAKGHDDFLFVVHGAVIKNFLLTFAHLKMDDRKKLRSPGNCDVIQISGSSRNWDYRLIYDGEAMQAADMEYMQGLEPFGLDDLPPVPEALRGFVPGAPEHS